MFKKDKKDNKIDKMYRQEPVVEIAECNCCDAATAILPITQCKINEEATVAVLVCQGKELKLSVNVPDVCRNYKLAVSVFIGFLQQTDEVLEPMNVYAFQLCIVPALDQEPPFECVDLIVEGFCFDLDIDLCSVGFIPIKVIAHYVFDEEDGFTI